MARSARVRESPAGFRGHRPRESVCRRQSGAVLRRDGALHSGRLPALSRFELLRRATDESTRRARRFETALFQRFESRLNVTPAPASPVIHPRDVAFDALLASNRLVLRVLQADKDAA